MPICNKCGSMKATAEMRRSPAGGFLCRDKARCALLSKVDRVLSDVGIKRERKMNEKDDTDESVV